MLNSRMHVVGLRPFWRLFLLPPDIFYISRLVHEVAGLSPRSPTLCPQSKHTSDDCLKAAPAYLRTAGCTFLTGALEKVLSQRLPAPKLAFSHQQHYYPSSWVVGC